MLVRYLPISLDCCRAVEVFPNILHYRIGQGEEVVGWGPRGFDSNHQELGRHGYR